MTTDITELAQREKFEAWFEGAEVLPWGYLKNRRISDSAYQDPDITDMWLAWKAASADLVEALEKARQRIIQLESRTVKLPDDEDGQAYVFGKWASGKLPATTGTMTIAYCEDAWRAAFEVFSTSAGIKWEEE